MTGLPLNSLTAKFAYKENHTTKDVSDKSKATSKNTLRSHKFKVTKRNVEVSVTSINPRVISNHDLKHSPPRLSGTASGDDSRSPLNQQEEHEYLPLPDLLSSNLKILFIGYNPSLRSSLIQHRFAHPTNRFWRLLHQSGLTSTLLNPEDDESLRVKYGFGFTELVKRPTRNISELSKVEMTEGVDELLEKIRVWQPKIVCCVGKGVYENILKGNSTSKKPVKSRICWGKQPHKNDVGIDVMWFVVPSTSGLVRLNKEDVLKTWTELNTLVKAM
ncbi:hypothetical protein WICPIJ_007317 [Wickerhamomyces pijperi]|uniref:Uracil-DNA glycosylase-like domain-containing protein n=1 Tax=Wickerhamomyces pijperi TaxID=599730 RepID=A0A9P8Q1W2_WICPI|nr:hypothetical protein WICPIJ_007317 [Wickerhamomyces pijperi]